MNNKKQQSFALGTAGAGVHLLSYKPWVLKSDTKAPIHLNQSPIGLLGASSAPPPPQKKKIRGLSY